MSPLELNERTICESYKEAAKKQNNLTYYCSDEMKHKAKVCSICNQLITARNEESIDISILQTKRIKKMFHKDTMEKNNIYNLSTIQIKMLQQHYTQKAYQSKDKSWLNKLILSPRSYPKKVKGKKCLGCCCSCKGAIKNAKRSNTLNSKLPKYAIAIRGVDNYFFPIIFSSTVVRKEKSEPSEGKFI